MLIATLLAVLTAVPVQSTSEPIALARGGSGTVCHCPCRTAFCDCTMHSETCHRCYSVGVNLARATLEAALASTEPPMLESNDAGWFEAGAFPEIRVRLEAA